MQATHALRTTPFPPLALARIPVPLLAAAALALAAALWGTSFVAAKVVLADLPPITVAALRFALAEAPEEAVMPDAIRGPPPIRQISSFPGADCPAGSRCAPAVSEEDSHAHAPVSYPGAPGPHEPARHLPPQGRGPG